MTYDLDALRAALDRSSLEESEAHATRAAQMLREALHSGLLDDAAMGRAVRAAAKGDELACEWLADSIQRAWDANGTLPPILLYQLERDELAQAAARALIAMQEGR